MYKDAYNCQMVSQTDWINLYTYRQYVTSSCSTSSPILGKVFSINFNLNMSRVCVHLPQSIKLPVVLYLGISYPKFKSMVLEVFWVSQLTINLIQFLTYQIKKTGPRKFNWLTQCHITSDKFRIRSQAGLLDQATFYFSALPSTDTQPPF